MYIPKETMMSTAWYDSPAMVGLTRSSVAALALALAACSGSSSSHAYPTSPIDIVVPAVPGGGSDNLARVIQSVIAEAKLVSQPVTVTNRPGGSGAVGLGYLAARPNDPYTILTLNDAVVSLALQPGYTGPTIRDVKVIAILALDEMVVVVPARSAFKTMQDVIDYGREHPRGLRLATEGFGGGDYVLGGLIERAAGISLTYVHTRGGAEAMQNVAGGHVDLAGPNPSETLSHLRGGLVRALAVSAATRIAILPDVPTLKELGIDVEHRMLRGIAMASGAPEHAVRYWQDVLQRVTETERWRTQYLDRFALTPHFLTGEQAGQFVDKLESVNRETLRRMKATAPQ
jgi:putative tricarboxylic transport membrane protein